MSRGMTFGLKTMRAIVLAAKELVDIIREVSKIDKIERIRLGSLEPRIITKEFLESLISDSDINEKFCPNFCLSLQSGCDKTLKKMNRHYTTLEYENSCNLIRKYMPKSTITTDVIVGFPGETEKDFIESLEFVKKMRFYNPNIFPFSKRKGTKAFLMDGQLTKDEKHNRVKIFIEECNKISNEIENNILTKYYSEDNLDYHSKNIKIGDIINGILVEEIIIEERYLRNDNCITSKNVSKKFAVGYTKE